MILVLDASAAAEIVLQRPAAPKLTAAVREADCVLAPTLFVAEVSNIFWKYYRFSEMPQPACARGMACCLALPDELADDMSLHREAFALACQTQRTVYDALYLVLARREDATFLTMDTALRRTARKHAITVV